MPTAIALFTRDLRVHDNPVLAAASRAEFTVPLFVLDATITEVGFAGRHRARFLAECLTDLDRALRARGAALIVRDGNLVEEVLGLAELVNAAEVHVAADVSGYAKRREQRLRAALAGVRRSLVVHEGAHTVVVPGVVTPAGSDHYAVFTPYWRRWGDTPMRAPARVPRHIRLPTAAEQTRPPTSAARNDPGRDTLLPGGETAGRARAEAWLAHGLAEYAEGHDALGADGTSRLSPYLHFGCISSTELVARARAHGGASAATDAFVRQLAWRDFYAQLLAARPEVAHEDYRRRTEAWRDDPAALQAWQAGQTGYPVVDAGMRQLAAEGWMHNRARLITGSFLTKTLGIDWRAGAAHFFTHLLDGDVANNCLNWQWVAGTGTDTRPYRKLNPVRQAARFDPDGAYVRRWVPELADLTDDRSHELWRLPDATRRELRYPEPIVPLTSR